MQLRFYRDAETGQPHMYKHGVSEEEVADVLERPLEDRIGAEGSRIALGQTRGGRYLRGFTSPIRSLCPCLLLLPTTSDPKRSDLC